MKRTAIGIAVFIVSAVFFFTQCVFYVKEHQKALVLQLGEPTLPVREPGLNFKLPLIQSIVTLDTRMQSFIIPKSFIRTSDLKALEIDSYACWRIDDPLTFVRTMRTEGIAKRRLLDIVYAQTTAVIGEKKFNDVVFIIKDTEATEADEDRVGAQRRREATPSDKMDEIRRQSRELAKKYRIRVFADEEAGEERDAAALPSGGQGSAAPVSDGGDREGGVPPGSDSRPETDAADLGVTAGDAGQEELPEDLRVRTAHEQAARSKMIEDILQRSREQAERYGVKIIDVRIKRMDLPNREAIFKRMIAEREKMANEYRFDGKARSLRIRAEAEFEREAVVAMAREESLRIRGLAEAEAMRVFSEAIANSPNFYEFFKSLEVYKKGLKGNSKVILSKDDPLFRFFFDN